MKAVVIHGQTRKGSTYTVTKMLVDELKPDDVREFCVNDIKPCAGCFTCFVKGETLCPHSADVSPIVEAIEQADIIVVESPNYCMGMTGQLKCLFDHMGYRWISHRPHPSMKDKVGVAVSTTAGMGASRVVKDIARHMFYWNIPKVFKLPFAVQSMDGWNGVSDKNKAKITAKISKTASRIRKKAKNVRPGIKSRFMFGMMKSMQKNSSWNPLDRKHWEDNGWL